jgi:hypothetical protein
VRHVVNYAPGPVRRTEKGRDAKKTIAIATAYPIRSAVIRLVSSRYMTFTTA